MKRPVGRRCLGPLRQALVLAVQPAAMDRAQHAHRRKQGNIAQGGLRITLRPMALRLAAGSEGWVLRWLC